VTKKIKPLGDRILVRQVEAEDKTKGGIILPDTAKEKPKEGIIEAAGPGKTLENGKIQPLSVKTGDRIIFASFSGTEVKINDKEYLIMKEEDVLGIISS
jgi:chaperonin GroES